MERKHRIDSVTGKHPDFQKDLKMKLMKKKNLEYILQLMARLKGTL